MSAMTYRPDIDGLRAISVLAVILFHIDESYLTGGFLGVDFFFVISGYLITKIIYKQKLNNNFSYRDFYIRRAKRILPALFFVLFITLISGYVILLPYEYYKLGVSTLSVLVFGANMQFALRTGDYFSANSGEWPLLHTWSLSVEEQYYFILPIIIIFVLKFFRTKLIPFFTVLLLVSFFIAQIMSANPDYAKISYYLIITRMGEMLFGSITAIAIIDKVIRPFRSEIVSNMAFISLFLLLIFVDKEMIFPGVISFIACLPVVILILSKDSFASKILSHKLLVSIGLVSFSLYIIHWPVLAFSRYIFVTELDHGSLPLIVQFTSVIIILLLSLISFYFVERPLRHVKISKLKASFYYFILPSMFAGMISLLLITSKGIPQRLDGDNFKAKYSFNHIDKELCPNLVNLGCVGGLSSDKKIILYGNSHAEHYYSFVDMLANKLNSRMELYASGGCGLNSNSEKCKSVRNSYNENKNGADVIILSFRWDGLSDQSKPTIEQLISEAKKITKNVVVLGQPPLWKNQPSRVYNCRRLGFDCNETILLSEKYPSYNHRIRLIAEDLNVLFIDPYDYVSNKNLLTDNGRLLYSDDDHLSVYGSKWLFQQFDMTELNNYLQ